MEVATATLCLSSSDSSPSSSGVGRRKAPKTVEATRRDGEAKKRSRSSRVGVDGKQVASAMHPGVTNMSEDDARQGALRPHDVTMMLPFLLRR